MNFLDKFHKYFLYLCMGVLIGLCIGVELKGVLAFLFVIAIIYDLYITCKAHFALIRLYRDSNIDLNRFYQESDRELDILYKNLIYLCIEIFILGYFILSIEFEYVLAIIAIYIAITGICCIYRARCSLKGLSLNFNDDDTIESDSTNCDNEITE